MRQYETGFLISPNLSEEETKNTIIQLADVVSQKNGKMIKQEEWGKRRLAYPIKNFEEAFYVFFHYEGEPDIPQELRRRFKQMDTILRHLTLKKDGKLNVRKKKGDVHAGPQEEERESEDLRAMNVEATAEGEEKEEEE